MRRWRETRVFASTIPSKQKGRTVDYMRGGDNRENCKKRAGALTYGRQKRNNGGSMEDGGGGTRERKEEGLDVRKRKEADLQMTERERGHAIIIIR